MFLDFTKPGQAHCDGSLQEKPSPFGVPCHLFHKQSDLWCRVKKRFGLGRAQQVRSIGCHRHHLQRNLGDITRVSRPLCFLRIEIQDCCTVPLLGPPVVTKTRRGEASPNRDLPLLSAPLGRRGCLLSEAIRLLQRSRSNPSHSQAESPARVPTSRVREP